MSVQWPNERETANRQPIGDASFKTEQDFRQLLNVCPEDLPSSFDEAVHWVIHQGGEIAELEQRMNVVCNQIGLQDFPDSTNLLMAWACAVALARSPKLQTWKKVKNFNYHSWQLAHWLAHAMLVRAEGNSDARKAYINLAIEAFNALDSFELVSLSGRNNQERTGAWAYWSERLDKLDDIWWGLRGWHGLMNYEEEFPLFHVMCELASDEFVHVIAQSANPYLVHSVLLVTGVGAFSPRFAEWKKIAAKSPFAFEVNGIWNGSVLAPLLLVEAREQLLQAGRSIPYFDASDADVERVKQEIASITEAVVTTLASRQDALPLFARWSTWLMRQLLSHSVKDINDVRSAAFVDETLIEAIGRKLKNQPVIQVSPSDAPAWEAWCYRCVLASHANSGFINPPDNIDFLSEWTISPDEWAKEKGRRLREHASLIVTMSEEMPGMAAHSLAYSIVRSESPTEAWIDMWNATHTLREIVEFGDADASNDEYHSRSEAGKLLLLVFRIGLAILDQRIAQCSSSDSLEARSQAKLHEALASAMLEMREIDDTLNRDEWLDAVRHLAIRRLIWEEQSPENQRPGRFPVFRLEDTPTFSDYLKAAKSDAIELLAVLQSVLLNDPEIPRLQNELKTASVNLSDVLGMVRRLNQYNPNKYPIDEKQLQRLEGLNPST
ncbi:MAG: hypothetical protein Q8L79_03505 [Methylobacter sp.]|uniref:hypothetical protein n=1 Tax=Methylobacter sp. TaxID=2051955 RepID=UPI00272EEFA1|nr:hypothetical protein [Methylobacter sp.]MDP1664169.1 hypothetical protein [Methylobacter sp.]